MEGEGGLPNWVLRSESDICSPPQAAPTGDRRHINCTSAALDKCQQLSMHSSHHITSCVQPRLSMNQLRTATGSNRRRDDVSRATITTPCHAAMTTNVVQLLRRCEIESANQPSIR